MSILGMVIVGIAGLLIGYLAAAFLSAIVMGWYGVSDFEGGRGMGAAFVLAYGLIGGIWLGCGWAPHILWARRCGAPASSRRGSSQSRALSSDPRLGRRIEWAAADPAAAHSADALTG